MTVECPSERETSSSGTPRPSCHEANECRRSWILGATATMLLEAGVDQHTVTSMMGHTSIATSRGYQTVSPDLSRRGRREGLKALGR